MKRPTGWKRSAILLALAFLAGHLSPNWAPVASAVSTALGFMPTAVTEIDIQE